MPSATLETPPTFELVTPAPSAIRARVTKILPIWRAYGHQFGETTPAMQHWLGAMPEFLHRKALWRVSGGRLRRLALPDGQQTGTWKLPDVASLFRAGGLVPAKKNAFLYHLRSYRPPLEPVYALDGDRTLWYVRGVDHRKRELAVPVLFDPDAAEPWTALSPEDPDDVIKEKSPNGMIEADGSFVIAGHIEGGAIFHIDEFITIHFGYRLNLERRTYRRIKRVPRGRPRDLLLSAPPGMHAYGLCFEHDPTEQYATARRYHNSKPLTLRRKRVHIRFALPPVARPPGRPPSTAIRLIGSPGYVDSSSLDGSASGEGIIIRDHLTVPGSRRVAVWLP